MQHHCSFPFYVDDDETDAEAFGSPMIRRTVRVMGVGVSAGARYSLRSVKAIRLFLGQLLR